MKTVRRIQQPATVKLLLGVLIATCMFAVAANAQPTFTGKFTLPYEVHWNHALLPAGEYSIRMNSNGVSATVRSVGSNRSFYTSVPIVVESENLCSCLSVTIRGNQRKVRSLNLPVIGKSLIFEPLTNTERKMFARKIRMDTVPVVTAQN